MEFRRIDRLPPYVFNVVNDLKKIILPEEAVTTTAKSKSLFGLGKGLLKRKAG